MVENKPGASGTVGSEIVAKSAPDGYTLLLQGTQHAINLSLYKQLPYDTLRDFAPVAYIASAPFLLVLHPSVPANTVDVQINKTGQVYAQIAGQTDTTRHDNVRIGACRFQPLATCSCQGLEVHVSSFVELLEQIRR